MGPIRIEPRAGSLAEQKALRDRSELLTLDPARDDELKHLVDACQKEGDTLGGVVSDRILKKTGDLQKARRNVICLGMLGAAACLAGVFFTKELTLVALLRASQLQPVAVAGATPDELNVADGPRLVHFACVPVAALFDI